MDCANKFDKICLCCLTEEGQMKNMQDESVQLIDAYKICSGIGEIEELSTKFICITCEPKLQSSVEFRKLCRASYQKLKEKADSIPDLYLDVKQEVLSDNEHNTEVNKESSHFAAVYIKSEFTVDEQSSSPKSKKKKKPASKKPLLEVPSDVDVSDLESEFICYCCDIVLPTHREYQKHFKGHKTGNGIPRIHKVCNICQVFTKKYGQHIYEEHKEYKPYKCKFCAKSFQTARNLRCHLILHAVVKGTDHECMACHEKFRFLNGFRLHIRHHKNEDNQYFCPFCGLTFDQFLPLSEHFQQIHDPSKIRSLYPCFRCKRVYLFRKSFDVHECSGKEASKKLKTENPVTCENCVDTFSSPEEYVCHQFVGCREVEPPFCAICNKTFTTKNKLQKHRNSSHVEKAKTFICEICGHGSVLKYKYDLHRASHENDNKFMCSHTGCKATFKYKMLLKSHQLQQHGKVIATYECYLCKKLFPSYDKIKRHMSMHSNSSEL